MARLAVVCLLALIGLLGAASLVHAGLGVDIYKSYSSSTYQCLQRNQYKWVIIRLLRSFGGLDAAAPGSANNVIASGLPFVDYYLFLCSGRDGFVAQTRKSVQQAKSIGKTFKYIWLDVEKNPSSRCGWSTSSSGLAAQCNSVKAAVSAGQQAGARIGIYSSRTMWQSTVGSSCRLGGNLPLWYAHYRSSGRHSFSGFFTFGDWPNANSPFMRQYSDTIGNTCGVHADANWYPDGNYPGGSSRTPPQTPVRPSQPAPNPRPWNPPPRTPPRSPPRSCFWGCRRSSFASVTSVSAAVTVAAAAVLALLA